MGDCEGCDKTIGRLERLQLRVVRRALRKTEKRFDIDIKASTYGKLCKACLLVKAHQRVTTLSMELQLEAEEKGLDAKEYGEKLVKDVGRYITVQLRKGGAGY